MRIHFDHPLSKCVREDGAPVRLYIDAGGCYYMIGARTQKQMPDSQYGDEWSWFTRHRSFRKQGRE